MGKLIEYIKQPLWKNWFVGEKIGQGNYSEVYKIYYENKISALKVKPVFADSIDSLNRKLAVAEIESDIMYRLKNCPYIVEYQEKAIQKIVNLGYIFMIRMEYVSPLTEIMKNYYIMSERSIIKIAHDIGKALAYIHENGIIHCDVKPANFFCDLSGNYKLGDFNISKYADENKGIGGTKGYIAPEISESGAVCSYQTDIYSFGVSLVKLSHGIDVSAEFLKIINKACAYDVIDRYKTVDEMLYDIDNIKTYYYVDPAEFS